MNQVNRVIEFMRKNGSITQQQAFEILGVTRLAAVISIIKTKGYVVKTVRSKIVNSYGKNTSIAIYYMGR